MGSLKRFVMVVFSITSLLFIIGAIVGYVGATNYTIHLVAFSVAGLLLTLASLARVTITPEGATERLGEVSVQGTWIWTSLSLVYITMSPASIYGTHPWALAILEVVGFVMLAFGAYTLFRIKRDTGVYLSI